MIKKYFVIATVMLVILGLTGCAAIREDGDSSTTTSSTTTERPTTTTTEAPATSEDIPAKNRPQTKRDTISLEGMEETFSFGLIDSSALGFSTYITDDMKAESASSGEGDSLTIFANFAGRLNKDAMAQFFARPDGVRTTVREMTTLAEETAKFNGFEVASRSTDAYRYEFSEAEFGIQKQVKNQTILGTVSIFRHGDRVYRFTVQYPEDYEEGFVPRVDKMLDDLMWYDRTEVGITK